MKQITSTLPLVALRGLTVVPSMIMNFDLNRDMSKKAVEQALNKTQKVLLVPQLPRFPVIVIFIVQLSFIID